MALIPVSQSQPKTTQTRSAKKGGGLTGSLIGAGLAGAAAATGGLSLAATPAILGAAGSGAAIGGLAGGAIAPAQQAQFAQSGGGAQNLSTVELGGMSNQLLAGLNSLEKFPELHQEYGKPMVEAYMNTQIALKNKDNIGRTA
jgi:hypothetical protein